MGYAHTARNTWEHYSAEKPSFEVYSHNMSLLIRESGLNEDEYYRTYGHLMGVRNKITVSDAKEIQMRRYQSEKERERKDIERIGRHVELLKLPEWEEEVKASEIASEKVGKAATAPAVLVVIFVGLLGYLLLGRKR